MSREKVLLCGTMSRKQFAKELHEFIRDDLREPDEVDFSAALVLKDLYDCHSCVQHIAQVYVKGIMSGVSANVFGNEEEVSKAEALLFFGRAKDPSKRLIVDPLPDSGIYYISSEEAMALGRTEADLVYVDVRLPEEKQIQYDFYPVVNYTLKEITLNPFIISHDTLKPVVLFCNKGYLSSLAAQVMVKSGFRKVYVVQERPLGLR